MQKIITQNVRIIRICHADPAEREEHPRICFKRKCGDHQGYVKVGLITVWSALL